MLVRRESIKLVASFTIFTGILSGPVAFLGFLYNPEHLFIIVTHSMQDWTATARHGVTRKQV